ncbi:MAG: hypothetical protein J6W98_03700 [Bacteroidales bacterium]|nr:hypothetical protein [Bacteroidales bacterium]
MRKILLAATVVALLPLLIACDKTNVGTDTRFEDPRFVQYAGQLILDGPGVKSADAVTVSGSTLASIELTESGLYAIGEIVDGALRYSIGDYTVDGEVYTLNGYGTIQFDNSGDSQEVELIVTPAGSATRTFTARFVRAAGRNQLYRGWTVEKTRVTILGWTTAAADFAGCNFQEIADFIRNSGHVIPDDIPTGLSLRTVSFTGTEKILFGFTDGRADVGEFKFNGSSFTYRWDNDKMGFTFLADQAIVEYQDGRCLLTIRADIEDSTTSGSVTFVLSPMD